MSKTKDVYGGLGLSWGGNVILPLEQAHKVQEIFARYAVGFGDAYRPDEPNIKYVKDYGVPDVCVTEYPAYDCTGMTAKQIEEWEQAVRHSEGNTFLTPQEFMAMRSDNNE